MSKFQLYQGDCLEVMKDIPDGSVDSIICDPPYGTTACKWDSIIPLDKMWIELKRIVKRNGAIVLFGNEPFSSIVRMSNLEMYKYDWKWDKGRGSNFVTVKIRPFNSFEDICVFYSKQCTYNPQMFDGSKYNHKGGGRIGEAKLTSTNLKHGLSTQSEGKRYPLSIISISNPNRNGKVHPTQKPVELMEYLIKTYTNEGETVLDFTMGSGTTGVACANTNRNFIGIELDKNYFNIAKERIENAYNQKEKDIE